MRMSRKERRRHGDREGDRNDFGIYGLVWTHQEDALMVPYVFIKPYNLESAVAHVAVCDPI